MDEVDRIHAELRAIDPTATVGTAIAALEAQRAAPPYAAAGGRCTLPQMYEVLSARSAAAKRQRTSGPDDGAGAEGAAAQA